MVDFTGWMRFTASGHSLLWTSAYRRIPPPQSQLRLSTTGGDHCGLVQRAVSTGASPKDVWSVSPPSTDCLLTTYGRYYRMTQDECGWERHSVCAGSYQ